MNFLPSRDVTLKTKLKEEDVYARLSICIEEEIFLKRYKKKYKGMVNGEDFRLQRILYQGGNSFVPVLYGLMQPDNEGAIIFIKIRL